MPNDNLKLLEERLAAMNATSDELRQSLETRTNARETLHGLHAEAEQQLQTTFSVAEQELQAQLRVVAGTYRTESGALQALNSRELDAFDTLTEEMKTRREHIKKDYGVLHEAVGLHKKLAETEG